MSGCATRVRKHEITPSPTPPQAPTTAAVVAFSTSVETQKGLITNVPCSKNVILLEPALAKRCASMHLTSYYSRPPKG